MKDGEGMDMNKTLKRLAVFTGVTLTTMHVFNRLSTYIATADNLLEEDEYAFYEWKYGKIAYKKKGSGSPLLLIHNFNVFSSSHEWDRIIDCFSKTNTVYSIDLLGCGCSDRPILTYTNFLYVQLLTDFIKDVIGEKADVIVSRDSSSFVLMTCANDETLIDRIIMINPQNLVSLAKVPSKQSKLLKSILYMPVIGTFIYNMKTRKDIINERFTTAYFYNQNKVNEKDVLACFESSHRNKSHSKYVYACQKLGYTNANISFCLSKLKNKITIIIGNDNPENTLSANQYQNQIPEIEIVGIDHAKMLPHIEKSEEFIETVKNILN